MVIRKQIVVSADIDRRIRRAAHARGISQSAVVAEAVAALPESASQFERMRPFIGIIKGGPTTLSDEVDEVLYG